jgi:hypothetical protein
MKAIDRAPMYLGIDLGKATDHTALVLAEPRPGAKKQDFHLSYIERVPLGTKYTAIVEHTGEFVSSILADPGASSKPEITLILDYTGVGTAVAEMFVDANLPVELILVTITSGLAVTFDDWYVHIPKNELVSVVQRLLQEKRLKVAEDANSDLLIKELSDFEATITSTGRVTYAAATDWRSGKHDDLVLAAALALWCGESGATAPEVF